MPPFGGILCNKFYVSKIKVLLKALLLISLGQLQICESPLLISQQPSHRCYVASRILFQLMVEVSLLLHLYSLVYVQVRLNFLVIL